MANVTLGTGITTTGQIPVNGKGYIKTLAELSALGDSDAKAYSYYENMYFQCVENNKEYIWREEVVEGESGGLLETSFTYPPGIITEGIDYSNRTFNIFEKPKGETQLEAFTVVGTSVGKYEDGETVPAHTDNNERWKDIGRKRILPTFTLPTANISADTNPNSSTEVGTTLTNLLLTASLTQNDGGAATNFKILKDDVEVLNHASNNTLLQTIELSTTPIIYKSRINYAEGTIPKNDSLGDSVANDIVAGIDDSSVLSYKGYRAVFYGDTTTKNITSVNVRTNLTKRLENSGNTFTLNTGNTNKIFQLWLPTGKTLSSVVDLDALNANITSSYISEALTVNDIGGNPITGTLYTMEQGVPYGTSHRHQITIG